jgi:hypothetical protein
VTLVFKTDNASAVMLYKMENDKEEGRGRRGEMLKI